MNKASRRMMKAAKQATTTTRAAEYSRGWFPRFNPSLSIYGVSQPTLHPLLAELHIMEKIGCALGAIGHDSVYTEIIAKQWWILNLYYGKRFEKVKQLGKIISFHVWVFKELLHLLLGQGNPLHSLWLSFIGHSFLNHAAHIGTTATGPFLAINPGGWRMGKSQEMPEIAFPNAAGLSPGRQPLVRLCLVSIIHPNKDGYKTRLGWTRSRSCTWCCVGFKSWKTHWVAHLLMQIQLLGWSWIFTTGWEDHILLPYLFGTVQATCSHFFSLHSAVWCPPF